MNLSELSSYLRNQQEKEQKGKTIYFPSLFVVGGPNRHWGGCFRYLLSTKGVFLPSNASRPPHFNFLSEKNTVQ
jgi:hypothetical protein